MKRKGQGRAGEKKKKEKKKKLLHLEKIILDGKRIQFDGDLDLAT